MAPVGLMQVSAVAAGSLVAAAWEGLVLAGLVAVCLRLLPGISAAARSVVWTVGMLAVCGLPFLHFRGGAADAASGPQVHLDERFGLALVAAWAMLSAWRAAQLFRSAVWLRGVWRRAVPVESSVGTESEILRFFASLRMTSVAERAAELCVSDEVDRPCVVGFFRPRVLVPTGLLEELSAEELQQIVLHEMEHLRRRDDWTNLLQKLSLVVFPLNPALIWIDRQLCVERELACDDRVLQATGARKAYAACLANLAEHSLVRRGVSLALGAWERQAEVVRRVSRILAGSEHQMGTRQAAGVVALLMVGVAGVTDGLAHAPGLVRFGPKVSLVAARVPSEHAPSPRQNVSTMVGSENVRPKLVNALMPLNTVPVAKPKRRTVRRVIRPMVAAMEPATNMGHPSQVSQDPTVVMVTWQVGSPMIVRDAQFTYAAVPTGQGWVFVRL